MLDPTTAPLLLVGIDCAVDPRKTGIAIAALSDGRVSLREARVGKSRTAMLDLLSNALAGSTRALITLDAPLGWPRCLARALSEHRAGTAIEIQVDSMCRRRTDDRVFETLKKRPLDVGADRIARTAHAALALLQELRAATNLDIPLAWAPGPPQRPSAIEVYPAATMASRSWSGKGYKHRKTGGPLREALVARLHAEMEIPDELAPKLSSSDHLLDASLCLLAAADFVRGDVVAPRDEEEWELARREGWIWFRPKP